MRPRARFATPCARCTATTSRAPSSDLPADAIVSSLAPILIIAAVAALALAMRSFGRRDEAVSNSLPGPAGATADDDDDEDSVLDDAELDDGMVEAAAITSDGWAFVPRGTGLELVPPGEDDELLKDQAEQHGSTALQLAMSTAPLNPGTGRRMVFWRPGESLAAGDMIAARGV